MAAAVCGLALLIAGFAGTPRAWAASSGKPCSSYPAPGQLAPAGASVPRVVSGAYAIFRTHQIARDRLALTKLPTPLQASGIVARGVRYLGRGSSGVRFYAVPARHYTPYEIAPLRCFASDQRAVERKLRPSLRRDYAHPAVCIVEVGLSPVDGLPLENCGPVKGIATAMLATNGLSLLGIAPDSVSALQATYLADPARIIHVRRNFYEISARTRSVAPCGVTWLEPSGEVAKTFEGCDYETAELPEYQQYQSFVTTQLGVVRSDVAALAAAIDSGELASAESAWLTAHLAWLLLGQDDKQYGAFGDLGNAIDGTSAGLVAGEASPDLTGFHKIELDLWTRNDLPAAQTDAAELGALVATLSRLQLPAALPATKLGLTNWTLRPHEVLEDALRDSLTGDDDYGSHTDLDSIAADVSVTRYLLGLLAPLLQPRAPQLVGTARRELTYLDQVITSPANDGIAIAALPRLERERVDAATDAALETLSRVPDLLRTGNT